MVYSFLKERGGIQDNSLSWRRCIQKEITGLTLLFLQGEVLQQQKCGHWLFTPVVTGTFRILLCRNMNLTGNGIFTFPSINNISIFFASQLAWLGTILLKEKQDSVIKNNLQAIKMVHAPLRLFKFPSEKANKINISWSFDNCLTQSWLLVESTAQPRGLHIH